jgi:hypothetical protein
MSESSTAAPTGQTPIDRVYLWLGQPDIGHEHLLMVHVNDPEAGPTFRPLMAVDHETATSTTFSELAQGAADALGVRAVLREFAVIDVADVLATVDPR